MPSGQYVREKDRFDGKYKLSTKEYMQLLSLMKRASDMEMSAAMQRRGDMILEKWMEQKNEK